jgi:hypothetical protein
MTTIANDQQPQLDPVASLGYEQADDGTFRATLTVSGLRTERQAQVAVAHMQRLFCGEEQEPQSD